VDTNFKWDVRECGATCYSYTQQFRTECNGIVVSNPASYFGGPVIVILNTYVTMTAMKFALTDDFSCMSVYCGPVYASGLAY
jgi:hypothetical protein